MEKLSQHLPPVPVQSSLPSPPIPTAEERLAKAIEDKQRRDRERLAHRIEAMAIPSRYAKYRKSDISDPTILRWVSPPDTDDDVYEEWVNWCKDGLYVYGSFGTGKTAQTAAVLRWWAVEMAYTCLFITTTELLDRIKRTFNGEVDDVLEDAKTVEVLLLDDIGAEKVTDWVRDRLFAVINARYNGHLRTIYTSNLTPEELAEHVGERITWRIMESCRVVKLTGPNRRSIRK